MNGKKITAVLLISGLIFIPSCQKDVKKMAVTTGTASSVLTNTAVVTGTIIDIGEGANKYGHCYSSTANPTIAGTKKEMTNPALGDFTSTLSGLIPNTTYYVKAFLGRGNDVVYGSEINFKTAPLTTPGAPTIGVATAGNALATVTFTAPASDGGSAITGYTVTLSPGGLTGTGSASPITVLGLTNGTAYTFIVTASNANGSGPASSASNSVIPSSSLTVPGAPTSVVATAENAQARVTFTAPASDGGSAITGYTVTSSPSGFIGTGSSSPITVTGLTNGTAYTFTVTATNVNGTGPASSASNSVTPTTSLTAPGAPTGVSATGGYVQAIVIFTAPVNNGGSAITGYTVTSSPGGFIGTGTASPITVTGLPGLIAYTFTVTATNAVGTGTASSSSNSVTPTTVPGAPTVGTATAGNAQASITFTVPVSDGGSAITGYTATSSPGGLIGTGSASPIIVAGLTNGTAYTFTVVAININGNSAASAASNSVTPSTVPDAPTIGTATAGNAQATVTFAQPVSDGGSAITGYTVTSSPGSFTGTGSASPITVTGLSIGTAYTFTVTATNANGTGVASAASNSVTPLFQDIDGNFNNTVTIGTQVWMKENLKTTKYNDGTSIPNVTVDGTWAALATGAYSDYNNTPANSTTYGRLYNWYAADNNAATKVASNGGKNVCPTGWHVPSDAEWTTLQNYLSANGYNYDGTIGLNKIAKSLASSSGWTSSPVTGAVGNTDYPAKRNATGFTALPGGERYFDGTFNYIGDHDDWWSSTENSTTYAYYRNMVYFDVNLRRSYGEKKQGFSVRCVKD